MFAYRTHFIHIVQCMEFSKSFKNINERDNNMLSYLDYITVISYKICSKLNFYLIIIAEKEKIF